MEIIILILLIGIPIAAVFYFIKAMMTMVYSYKIYKGALVH